MNFVDTSDQPMQKTIAVAIEGPGADRALADFLAIAGIQGTIQPREVMRDGGLLVAIGGIVGIVGGIAQVVSSIIDWRDRWKKGRETERLSVTIQDAKGNRLALNDATPEQIAAVLQTLDG